MNKQEYMIECGSLKNHKNADNAIKYGKRFDIYKKVEDSGGLEYTCEASWVDGKFNNYNIRGGPSKHGIYFDNIEELGKWLGKKLYNDLITHKLGPGQSYGKLRAGWSIELEQDLKYINGIDISAEFANAVSIEIQKEIDKDMITKMTKIAKDMSDEFFKDLIRKHINEQ